MEPQEINVGIDASSIQLDIFVISTGQFFTVTNDKYGIKDTVQQL
jgi:transposase